jgi:hypothetical protein
MKKLVPKNYSNSDLCFTNTLKEAFPSSLQPGKLVHIIFQLLHLRGFPSSQVTKDPASFGTFVI